jgi:UTP--glucose-1-phosphate uridylyltransferase
LLPQEVSPGGPPNVLVPRIVGVGGDAVGAGEAIRKVVLPAAGLGLRLRPLTAALPKEMLPVGRRLVIQHVLEECAAAGLDRVLAVISRRKLALLEGLEAEDAPLDEQQMPLRLVYTIFQRVQGGLGHAVLHGEGFAAGESFAVALPDTLVIGGETPILARLVRIHREAGAAATIAAEEVPLDRVSRYGILAPAAEGPVGPGSKSAVQDQGLAPGPAIQNPKSKIQNTSQVFRIADVVEKPSPGTEPSRLAISARYVFSPAIFPALRRLRPGAKGELQLTDAIRDLARQGLPVLGVRLAPGERRLDIGSFDSYREAVEIVSRGEGDAAGGEGEQQR